MRFLLIFCFLAWSAPGFSQHPGQIAQGVQHTGAEYGAYDVKIDALRLEPDLENQQDPKHHRLHAWS